MMDLWLVIMICKLRQILRNRVLERHLAFFDQHHDSHTCDCLGHRGTTEDPVFLHPVTNGLKVTHLAIACNQGDGSGNAFGVHLALQILGHLAKPLLRPLTVRSAKREEGSYQKKKHSIVETPELGIPLSAREVLAIEKRFEISIGSFICMADMHSTDGDSSQASKESLHPSILVKAAGSAPISFSAASTSPFLVALSGVPIS